MFATYQSFCCIRHFVFDSLGGECGGRTEVQFEDSGNEIGSDTGNNIRIEFEAFGTRRSFPRSSVRGSPRSRETIYAAESAGAVDGNEAGGHVSSRLSSTVAGYFEQNGRFLEHASGKVSSASKAHTAFAESKRGLPLSQFIRTWKW